MLYKFSGKGISKTRQNAYNNEKWLEKWKTSRCRCRCKFFLPQGVSRFDLRIAGREVIGNNRWPVLRRMAFKIKPLIHKQLVCTWLVLTTSSFSPNSISNFFWRLKTRKGQYQCKKTRKICKDFNMDSANKNDEINEDEKYFSPGWRGRGEGSGVRISSDG